MGLNEKQQGLSRRVRGVSSRVSLRLGLDSARAGLQGWWLAYMAIHGLSDPFAVNWQFLCSLRVHETKHPRAWTVDCSLFSSLLDVDISVVSELVLFLLRCEPFLVSSE